METVLLYFGKVIVCSGVMFLYYQLSLKDKTFHHYNRFYLLSAMLIPLLLPLLRIEDFTIEVNSGIYRLIDKVKNFNNSNDLDHDYIYFRIILSALGLVSFSFLGRFIYGIFRIRQLKSHFRKESFNGINFYRTDLTEAPFSYFKNLFWKNSIMLDSDIGKQILKHEMVHIEQKHSFDKIFIEIITSVFWFNPFFHLIRKEISLIHEYLADKKAVRQSDTKAFAQMLLASHFSGTQLPATSPFLSSNLKKRLKMLQKPKTKFGYAHRIFALPVIFSVAFAYMVNAKNREIKATNAEIEKAVSQIKKDDKLIIKKDTVTPHPKNSNVIPQKDIHEKQKRISALNKNIAEKSKSLKELKPESEEFQTKVKEIAALAAESVKIADADADFKINKKVKRVVDWEIIQTGESRPVEMSDFNFDVNYDGTSGTQVKVYAFKDKDLKGSLNMKRTLKISETSADESAATAKRRAKLDKERAKLDVKRAKLESERARLDAERRVLDGNRRVYIYGNTFKEFPGDRTVMINAYKNSNNLRTRSVASGMKNIGGTDGMTIYINGKESTGEEMQALDAKSIKRMDVNKRTEGGKAYGEIKIETK